MGVRGKCPTLAKGTHVKHLILLAKKVSNFLGNWTINIIGTNKCQALTGIREESKAMVVQFLGNGASAVAATATAVSPLIQSAGLEVGMVGNALLTDTVMFNEVALALPEPSDEVIFGEVVPILNAIEPALREKNVRTDSLRAAMQAPRNLGRVAEVLDVVPHFAYVEAATAAAEKLQVTVRIDRADQTFQRFRKAFETNLGMEIVPAKAAAPKLSFEDRYEVLQKIGKGGQIIAYKVRDRITGELGVARRTTDPEEMEKLVNEAKALMNLDHPNIVKVHDYYIVKDTRFATQEFILITNYIEGKTLSEFLAFGWRLTEAQLTEFRDQMLDALREAHAHGIVHRDIKPTNVMVSRNEDGSLKFTLIDFGLIKFVGGSTGTKSLGKGTIYYMAPEQIFGGAITPATDIHGLGLTLLAMARGKERTDDIRHQKPADDIARLRAKGAAYLSAAFLDRLEGLVDEDPGKRLNPVSDVRAVPVDSARLPSYLSSGNSLEVFGMANLALSALNVTSNSDKALVALAIGASFFIWGRDIKKKRRSLFNRFSGQMLLGGLFFTQAFLFGKNWEGLFLGVGASAFVMASIVTSILLPVKKEPETP